MTIKMNIKMNSNHRIGGFQDISTIAIGPCLIEELKPGEGRACESPEVAYLGCGICGM
jgi:hypothetical protein